jgi:hypothetical protein
MTPKTVELTEGQIKWQWSGLKDSEEWEIWSKDIKVQLGGHALYNMHLKPLRE